MPDYRPVPESDRDEFRRLLTYAFRPTERYDPEEDDEEPKPAQPGDPRGIYDGDELLATGRHHWFTLDVRGEPHGVGGLSAVSTPPQNRRRGLVRRLLAESLAEYREREHYLSALWPFEYAFYRKFGWATTSRYAETTFDPDALSFVDGVEPPGEGTGRYRELSGDDWKAMETVYRAANDRGLSMHRTEEWWRKRVLTWWEAEPYAYGWERDGDLRGYLVYDVQDDDEAEGRTMRVNELCAADHEARLELLRFCRYHDSQVKRVRLYGPVDTTLQDLVSDPRGVEVEVKPGPMSRLVDVERALDALSYPEEATGTVTLAVGDDLVEWNDGTFRLAVEDGRATCERTDGAPDVRVDVGTLSQVAVGYHAVEDARLYGDLSVEDEGAAETLAALFPPEGTFLREGF
ncbi:GNAT family N-acetyltransferase [Halomarina litorea]|uniref:GNAT family N-acetyltransferase n=1 Tax=Halomarina litorea TaxID=2961595 RepID=UPI0020C346F9|nr:GNAT family N-acetyltransferase [Halomarina sp. BCD28]